MSLIKRDDRLLNPGFPAFFNDFFTRDLWNWNPENHSPTGTTLPAVNIRETEKDFEVDMAAPGMKKSDFRIELDGNLLTITSEKVSQQEEKDGNRFNRKEFSYQSFTRSFQLSKDVVDEEKIHARYDNGMLYLQIPKKESARQKFHRMIKVD